MSSFCKRIKEFSQAVKPNYGQFLQACLLTLLIGAIVSTCKITQALMTGEDKDNDGKIDKNEGEFIVESKLESTQYLVAFGVSKAIANLAVGITSDIFGRKKMMIFGWLVGLIIPIMVIPAKNWETIVASNVFLGIQQGFCWTLTIVYMIDYAGVQNRAFTIGINETLGYTSVAIFNVIGAAMVDDKKKDYREGPYYMILGFIIFSLLISIFTLKENKQLVLQEHKQQVENNLQKQPHALKDSELEKQQQSDEDSNNQNALVENQANVECDGQIKNKSPKKQINNVEGEDQKQQQQEAQNSNENDKLLSKELANAKIVWPDNSIQNHSVFRLTFVQSSFLNTNLMCCNIVGLMINFLTAFAWGIFTKWMKTYGGDNWDTYTKETTASIILIYSIPKGVFQFIFGFISDRIGRKKIVAIGLSICVVGLIIISVGGKYGDDSDTVLIVFGIGAFILGFGTAVMYANVLAASTENTLPINRASALGTYRFWRDSGYWIGGLFLGAIADEANIPIAIGVTSGITVLVIIIWCVFFEEVKENTGKQQQQQQRERNQTEIPLQQIQ